jgi:hypothetical protein
MGQAGFRFKRDCFQGSMSESRGFPGTQLFSRGMMNRLYPWLDIVESRLRRSRKHLGVRDPIEFLKPSGVDSYEGKRQSLEVSLVRDI